MSLIPTTRPAHNSVNFMRPPLQFFIRLKGTQVEDLYNMILWCFSRYETVNNANELEDIEQLELLVMAEVQQLIYKKINNEMNINHYKLKLSRPQARTLFTWMSDYHFEHPVWEILSKNVVEQLYKQVNNY